MRHYVYILCATCKGKGNVTVPDYTAETMTNAEHPMINKQCHVCGGRGKLRTGGWVEVPNPFRSIGDGQ